MGEAREGIWSSCVGPWMPEKRLEFHSHGLLAVRSNSEAERG